MSRLCCLHLFRCGFGPTPQTTKQSELPSRADSQVEIALISVKCRKRSRNAPYRAFERLAKRVRLCRNGAGRFQSCTCLLRSSAGSLDAVERGREVEVLLNRSLDDLRKLRILKSDPPSIQRWRLSGRLPC